MYYAYVLSILIQFDKSVLQFINKVLLVLEIYAVVFFIIPPSTSIEYLQRILSSSVPLRTY